MSDEQATSFKITGGKGFRIRFGNGYAMSVQWGPGNYCNPQGGRFGAFGRPGKAAVAGESWASDSAEVAVFEPSGEFLRIQEHDDVAGWVTADQVGAIIGLVSTHGPASGDESCLLNGIRAILDKE